MISSTTLSLTLLTIFIIFYHTLSPFFKTEKQRAYILSTLSSGTMSILSIPFVISYIRFGFQKTYLDSQIGWRAEFGRFGIVFFGTYLFTDLALGYFRYPKQIGLLTGWIHHVVYIALMYYISTNTQTPIFMTGAIMELPTFDLAMSNLFPIIRHDLRFLSSFFLIRILYHIILLLDILRPSSQVLFEGSYVPSVMLSLALLLHISWFRGGLNGYLKRQRAKSSIRKKETSKPVNSDVQVKITDTEPVMDDNLINSVTKIDSTIPSNTLPPPHSSLGTPEDSPLVTPYTPSQTPFSLRDAYVFQNIPTIKIPTMPNIPISSIPTLSLSDMNGFKDAVKSRWEEQRGRFAAVRGGRGGISMGMGLDLGGLRLRRGGDQSDKNQDDQGIDVKVHEVGVDED